MYEEKLKNCTSTSVVDNDEQENFLNISGVLSLYRGFISTFVSQIPDSNNEAMSFNLKIELTSHEIQKLNLFSKSNVDAEALAQIQDITDILKSMYLSMAPSQLDEYKESLKYLLSFFQLANYNQFNLVVIAIAVSFEKKIEIFDKLFSNYLYKYKVSSISYFFFFRRRYPGAFSFKNIIIIGLLAIFFISVMSNHKLLNQVKKMCFFNFLKCNLNLWKVLNFVFKKKQIKKQQTLKLSVPAECLNGKIQIEQL